MMDIVFSSTTQLAAAIRAGHVSATEVLEAHLTQIDTHNPALNAVVTLDAERAHKRAREADKALAQGQVWGPLHGIPFTLKDAHATVGMCTTIGFSPLDHVPQEDSTVTARLKAAGGILIDKTNVAAMVTNALQSTNPIFGRTNNPWDIGRTPGGSSGGAAVAVTSGISVAERSFPLLNLVEGRVPAGCG
jgi:amidase